MGCETSRPSRSRRQGGIRNLTISAPQNIPTSIPRTRVDENGRPVQAVTRTVSREVLLAALNHVSAYISERGQHVSFITTGGAVSTLYLQSRPTTHDVDVFGSDFDNNARNIVNDAMEDAQVHIPALGTDWLNTSVQIWIPEPFHTELTVAARQQNVKVFDGPGLTIYAAPWEFAFSSKICRLLKGADEFRSYDLADAVSFIHEFILNHGNEPVAVDTALGWARHYTYRTNPHVLLTLVNEEYRRRYDMDAFV
ncbi:hypothetical protein AK830_g8600 [Neonectria ditissima]|uniref:DUF7582 domain-containing protein n=1 Tax=Neonectria ditissima TaxID=78410 RepID=A0A0P7BC26_9HYPO|nr:hypothetical protein AK830_g8600 [Neonectria ditissima]